MAENFDDFKASIVEVKTEFRHVNKRLNAIDEGMKQIQNLMLQQNELQRDILGVTKSYDEIKDQLFGYGKRLTTNEDMVKNLITQVHNIPSNFKINIFDYIWKYASVAIGGYIALKITGVLP